MINLLSGYIENSLPPHDREDSPGTLEKRLRAFETNENLKAKVDGRKLKPFYGNTAVFLLEDSQKQQLSGLQKELYETAGWMLAERLEPDTFHMTLHDLVNGPELTAGLEAKMEDTQLRAEALLQQWRSGPELRMETTWLFNMVNTSVVLGLAPKDVETERRLSRMYSDLNQVVPLGHKLTPHITMAYYSPGVYTVYDLKHLHRALHGVKQDITLKMENLVLQNFTDMNSYHTVYATPNRRA